MFAEKESGHGLLEERWRLVVSVAAALVVERKKVVLSE